MLSTEVYGVILDVLHNFDHVGFVVENGEIQRAKGYLNKHGERTQLIQYTKQVDGRTAFVVEAVTDAKQGNLVIISVRKSKKQKGG